MKVLFLSVAIAIFATNFSRAQWIKVSVIPAQKIVSLTVFHDTLLAASGQNLIYRTTDAGNTWDSLMVSNDAIDIITVKIIEHKIYAGTFSHGIYTSADHGLTWQHRASNFAISDIKEAGTVLYAATLGEGILVYDQPSGNWLPFNNSLPSYSVNVNGIIGTDHSLIAAAGANGTFYRYNFSANNWEEEFYYGLLKPGLMIDKIINSGDTIFVVSGNRIIRSNNDGISWSDDNTGTPDGYARTISSGSKNYYVITNIPFGGTWLQQRSKLLGTGTTWAADEEFQPDGFAYDILEFQNRLFLARADGLYVKDLLSGIEDPPNGNANVELFLNPSFGNAVTVKSDKAIGKIDIYSCSGERMYASIINRNEFTFHPNLPAGIYFVHLNLENGESLVRKIIITR